MKVILKESKGNTVVKATLFNTKEAAQREMKKQKSKTLMKDRVKERRSWTIVKA